MNYNYAKGEYTLSTGKTFYANNGILGLKTEYGLNTRNGEVELTQGYDGFVKYFEDEAENEEGKLTEEEKKEIAHYMIRMWSIFGKIDT